MFDEFLDPIHKILTDQGIQNKVRLLKPPSVELGDFSLVVNQLGSKDPGALAEVLRDPLSELDGIESVEIFEKTGKRSIYYLNFRVAETKKQEIQQQSISAGINEVFAENYGMYDLFAGKTAIVEHTSANPISPIHVGNLRNSVQGDTFARILKAAGYTVFRHFYVNDVGLQIGIVVVGYKLVKELNLKPPIKIDLWSGQIYAIMNCIYTIQKLKSASIERGVKVSKGYVLTKTDIKRMKTVIKDSLSPITQEIEEIQSVEKPSKQEQQRLKQLRIETNRLSSEISDIEKYAKTFSDLQQRFPDLFKTLLDEVGKINLQDEVAIYLKKYETNQDQEVTGLFREIVEWVLSAFSWTLQRFNITFDQFDFESAVSWSGLPTQIIEELSTKENASVDGEAVRYSYPSASITEYCKAVGISKKELPIKGQIPELQLRRSDGTALYAAKDIAYSITKFKDRKADIVYNVISAEQSLPQFQMLLPLHELGMTQYAANLKHFSYELVELLGRTMSGRLAKYITADDYFDETYIRARMAKRQADAERSISLPTQDTQWQEEHEILTAVTLASTRFPLIETAPTKRIELDLDRELDFRRNAGPFVQYAHARANSLIERVYTARNLQPRTDIDVALVTNDETTDLITHLLDLKNKVSLAVEKQDPSQIANWTFQLAQLFMKYYEKFPVLKEENEDLSAGRLTIVYCMKIGLETGLNILGIPPADRL